MDSPAIKSVLPLGEELDRIRAQSFLESHGLERVVLKSELLIAFYHVFRFSGVFTPGMNQVSGWVVGGNVPHLQLNDDEITTPIEALAIYALYLDDWIGANGAQREDGSIPAYRIPENWELLSISNSYQEWNMGTVYQCIRTNIVPNNVQHLIHHDIFEKCKKRGWLNVLVDGRMAYEWRS
ncbi:MAG: hypothetical protein JNJ45_06000 [Chthonomonas sp.]|nr:hypothetical protein [Chthonomonas sp.]